MSDLSELDDLLAELDTIDTGSSKAPVRASNNFNKPAPTPINVKPTPVAVKTTPVQAPKPATASRASYSTNANNGTDWDELDALVAKFDNGPVPSNRDSMAQSSFDPPPSASTRASVAPTNRSNRAPTDLNSLPDLDSSYTPPSNNRSSQMPSTFPNYNSPKPTTPTNNYAPANNNSNPYSSPSNNSPSNNRNPTTGGRRMTQIVKTAPSIPGACPACSQMVTGEHLLAMGQKWHSDHFNCTDCGSFIAGEFYEHEGKPKCRNCFESKYNCSKCGGQITGEYYLGGGKLFHTHCIERHNCGRCGGQISATERELRALDRYWHAHCFTCTGCRNDLTGSFFSVEGQPFCENCANNRNASSTGSCAGCGRPIAQGAYVAYENRSFHNECFTCSRCRTVLNLSGFYTLNGQQVCGNCTN